jgi:hypothetical protein
VKLQNNEMKATYISEIYLDLRRRKYKKDQDNRIMSSCIGSLFIYTITVKTTSARHTAGMRHEKCRVELRSESPKERNYLTDLVVNGINVK